jgi:hypothetical protein
MKIITVASYPRTGSSLLLHALNRYRITALLEIFHTNPAVARKHLAADTTLRSAPGFIDSYSRDTAIQSPSALLDAIAQIKKESSAIIFKVFPGHLPENGLAEIITKSDTLLIHSRNRLHTYISDVIATRTGSWTRNSTSNQFIDFQQKSFKHYSRHIHNFLSSALGLAIDNKTPIVFSSYEALMESSVEAAVGSLLRALLGSNDLSTQTAGRLPQRQDERLLASDKVSNPGELLAFLNEQDLIALNNGNVDVPFSRYALIN